MTRRTPKRSAFRLGETRIAPGERETVELPIPRLYTHTEMALPVHVIHGRRPGPRLFVSAALHGDELNGVEIVRRLLGLATLRHLRGTLLAIPIANVHACIQRTRELPDGRDLNRAFPGSASGSLAARLAHLFMQEIVAGSDYGIDLHTGAKHRNNLPQIRCQLDAEDSVRLAQAFGAPVILHSSLRDGSLRGAVQDTGCVSLLYEAGEALRFDEAAIRVGVRGIVAVMREIGMLPKRRPRRRFEPVTARESSWLRSPASGILRLRTPLGATVKRGQKLAVVSDPFGEDEASVTSHATGVVIGRTNLPLVYAGEALFHIARFEDAEPVDETLEAYKESFDLTGEDRQSE